MAEEVTVRGRVQGGIKARKVLLATTCHVEGNILHEAFAVETGAFFEGNCRHSDDPFADENARKAAPTEEHKRPLEPQRPQQPAPGAISPSAVSGLVSRPATNVGGTPAATYTPLKTS